MQRWKSAGQGDPAGPQLNHNLQVREDFAEEEEFGGMVEMRHMAHDQPWTAMRTAEDVANASIGFMIYA